MGLLDSLHLGRSKKNGVSQNVLGHVAVRKDELLNVFPGPTFVVTEELLILDFNEEAKPLIEAFRHRTEGKLAEAIHEVLRVKKPAHQTFTYGEGEQSEVVDLTLFPMADQEDAVLVTGKNVTLQRNLTSALVTSRQLFKDLVTCTAEFVWETDVDGCFRYVSPRGAIGFSAVELDGRVARKLIISPESSDAAAGAHGNENEIVNPFESKDPLENQIVWLRDKSNALACMRISSIPVFDDTGNWIGCRGAGHDITGEMAQKARLDSLAAQEKVFSSIIDAIRHEIVPQKLFEIAGNGACDALHSTRIWLSRRDKAGFLQVAFKKGIDEQVDVRLANWFTGQMDQPVQNYDLIELEEGEWRIFISPIFSGNQVDGAIALVRRREATELEESEKRLLRLISEHLGVALIQIKAREKLEQLSRTDELSGLLNRRAFHEDVVKRVKHGHRTKVKNALFYIDLDNFKPVNDRFGHEKGDEVLKGVSELLSHNTRIGDLIARLGGDEFAMWLDDISLEMAIEKAKDMQVRCRVMSEKLGVLDPSLSFSIGIAMTDGNENETLDDLLAQADAAMYDVKAKGKGTYSIASEMTEGAEKKDV